MLGLPEIVEGCCEYLCRELHASNALGILRFAEAHHCEKLEETTMGFINAHFPQVAQEDELLDIPQNLLVRIMSSESLHVDTESQVFNAAIRWILGKRDTRGILFPDSYHPLLRFRKCHAAAPIRVRCTRQRPVAASAPARLGRSDQGVQGRVHESRLAINSQGFVLKAGPAGAPSRLPPGGGQEEHLHNRRLSPRTSEWRMESLGLHLRVGDKVRHLPEVRSCSSFRPFTLLIPPPAAENGTRRYQWKSDASCRAWQLWVEKSSS